MTENMNNTPICDISTVPRIRQANLKGWLAERGLSVAELGRRLGVTAAGAHLMIHGETVHPYRHAQLLELGIPETLLPAPLLRKGGFRPNRPAPINSPTARGPGGKPGESEEADGR
jgi:hypothetical protein